MSRVIRSPQINADPYRLRREAPAPQAELPAEPVPAAVAPDPAEPSRAPESLAPVAPEPQVDREAARLEELRRGIEAELRGTLKRDAALARQQAQQEGHDEGFEAGRAAGEAAGREAWEARLAELDAVLAAGRAALEEGIQGLQEIGTEIVFEAITRIIGQELREPDGVARMVREVVGRARQQALLTIRLGPRDYELVQAQRERLESALRGVRFELAVDERIELGGCLVDYDGGSLDARLELQLARLKEALLQAQTGGAGG